MVGHSAPFVEATGDTGLADKMLSVKTAAPENGALRSAKEASDQEEAFLKNNREQNL